MLYAEFILLLFFLYVGSRFGGVGLGVVSGIGLLVEVFILPTYAAIFPAN